MTQSKVWVFFYGSFMSLDVLVEIGLKPEKSQVAKAYGFDIQIRPVANLVPQKDQIVYGVLVALTHEELIFLYAYVKRVFCEDFEPNSITVEAKEGQVKTALTYICRQVHSKQADHSYIDRVLKPARDLGFPAWYVRKIEAFKSNQLEAKAASS